ncbi:hypothetical protein ON010_g11357 [Phytophthora cinnamomi]|nr:hypothetical protein ON010_g11357 [Phytophthora cinnamomi]
MSEQKNVKEPQPAEEHKDATVAVPATVDDVATKVTTTDSPAAEPLGAVVRQPEEAPLDRVLGGEPQERLHLQHGGGLLVEGIRPMWEDPINAKGGKWIFTNPRSRKARLDECWLYVMLSLIGETLQDEDDVCGAVVSVRKAQDRIAIWSATANAEDRQKAIGRGFRQALVDLGKNETLKYQSHADAAASGSSFQNEVLYEA